jgi:hypothetical protein
MGVRFNRDGMVIILPGGRMLHDSMVSAQSGRMVAPGGVLEKVPGVDGLHLRLAQREARQMSKGALEALYEQARAWYQAHTDGVSTGNVTSTPPGISDDDGDDTQTLDDLTLADLRKLAAAADIPGRSNMNRQDLIDALRAHPERIILDTFEDEDA